MSYVDGFLIPLPKKNVRAYRRMAEMGRNVTRMVYGGFKTIVE